MQNERLYIEYSYTYGTNSILLLQLQLRIQIADGRKIMAIVSKLTNNSVRSVIHKLYCIIIKWTNARSALTKDGSHLLRVLSKVLRGK